MSDRWRLRQAGPELRARYTAQGWWDDQSLGDLIDAGLHRHARQPLRVRSALRPWQGTLGDVHRLARGLAAGLRGRGVQPGDVVAFQLPNWVEAAATFYAATQLGVVLVPIVHFYGAREVGHILAQSEARALVVADRFRHLDHLAMLDELRPGLSHLETVVVVGDRVPGDAIGFDELAAAAPLDGPTPTDPDGPALIAYTSGTTAQPKGVIHTHRSLVAEVRQMSASAPPPGPPALVGAPVGHAIGMLGALLLPVHRGQPIHLIDVWDPATVLAAMLEDSLSAGAGATYFLTSLLDHPDLRPRHRELMHQLGMGGAPVPPAVAERAEALGIDLVRFYGSTEHPSTTGSSHADPRDRRLFTDGRPLPGVELRLLDEAGSPVDPGTAGEIHSRGPDLFAGYTDERLSEAALDPDGWYATGDVGVLDEAGFLTITDRRKDIIIRGGENISAAEVEELLLRLPGVAEAAVVAAPDPRLGEHGCAFLRLLPGAPAPTVDGLRVHLETAGLARQKCPEEVRVVPDLPRTASGKVRKAELRELLRTE